MSRENVEVRLGVCLEDPNLDPTSANFGPVSSQTNLPRNIQLGMKVIF